MTGLRILVYSHITTFLKSWMPKNSFEPPHDKTNKMTCLIRPVWSETTLSAWRPLTTYWAHREDSDKTGWMPRLIWVVSGRTCHCVCFVMRRLIWLTFSFKQHWQIVLKLAVVTIKVYPCVMIVVAHWHVFGVPQD